MTHSTLLLLPLLLLLSMLLLLSVLLLLLRAFGAASAP